MKDLREETLDALHEMTVALTMAVARLSDEQLEDMLTAMEQGPGVPVLVRVQAEWRGLRERRT